MPGAVIVADQSAGAGAGSPGVARKDLWAGRTVSLYQGASGNNTFLWEILSRPPGSGAALATTATAATSFTPDLRGTYRIRLITNNGGPGNIQTLVYRVRRDSSGAITGWALPGIGERKEESNYDGNDRGWAEVLETIFAEIAIDLAELTSDVTTAGASVLQVVNATKFREIPILLGERSTLDEGFNSGAAILLNLSKYPATIGALARTLRFQIVVSATGELGGDALPWVVEARLYNHTHGYVVTDTLLAGPTTGDVAIPVPVTSNLLSIGTTAGTVRSDTPAVYGIEFRAKGVGVLETPDHVTIHSASLLLEYV